MSMLESEATQKKGIVVVLYLVDQFRVKEHRTGLGKLAQMVQTLPVHFAGIHFCCDDYRQYLMVALVRLLPGPHAAVFRAHYGTHLECRYLLRGFGIPDCAIPMSPIDEEALMYYHTLWYHERQRLDTERDGAHSMSATFDYMKFSKMEEDDHDFSLDQQFEETSNNEATSSVPIADVAPTAHAIATTKDEVGSLTGITKRSNDVLFGQNYKLHAGTVRFHEIVIETESTYESILDPREKTEYVRLLVQNMKATWSRFISYDKDSQRWTELDDKIPRNKISKIFRNHRRSTAKA